MGEDLATAVNRLTAAGYTDGFRAEAEGLRAVKEGCVHAPECLVIDEIVRFEGMTDPDDSAIVFALSCPEHGTRGTYAIPFGARVPAADAEMVERLQKCVPRAPNRA